MFWKRSRQQKRPESNYHRPRLESLEDRLAPAVDFTIVNDWGSGFQAAIEIQNTESETVSGWELEFDLSHTINSLWNGSIVSSQNGRYVVRDAGYNSEISPGQTRTIGFTAAFGEGDLEATNFIFNGSAVGEPQPPTPPDITIAGASVVEGDPGTAVQGFFHTSGNQIVDANGQPVRIAGVNWFGMETTTFAPHGLWARNWQDMMDQMKAEGFNTIRLPFSNQLFDAGSTPNGIDFGLNPDLQGQSGIQIMDKIVDYAGEIGLRIFLDNHRSAAGDGPNGSGLWFDDGYTESRWIGDWVMLAERYAGNPTVIGADLANEPHNAANWGTGDANDWRLAAERAGNAVLAVNSDWLIIVEGVQNASSGSYWWGGNLSNAGQFPVRLDVANRLVYSAHDYPASVFAQQWFNAPDYPNNLIDIWDTNWGYLFRQNIAPVLIGEFGSRLETASDQLWLSEMIDYLNGDLDGDGTNDLAPGSQGISWTWWSWNPNSGDTGGILNDDWQTVIRDKVDQLAPMQFEFGETGSAPTLQFTVTLSEPAAQSVTVDFATTDGTAVSGIDYVAASGTLTFAPGQTQKTVAVSILSDTVVESDEAFFMQLSNAQNGNVTDSEATGTIVDDDTQVTLPQLSAADTTLVEGDSGQHFAEFIVTLSSPSQDSVTVDYTVSDASAIAGVDYESVSGTLTFEPGETSLVVQVPIFGDEEVEPDEQFILTLSNPDGATLQRAQATGTILNDDAQAPSSNIDFNIVNDWGSGFQGAITVNNPSPDPLTGWTLEFDAAFDIVDIWNAEIVSHIGNHYIIRGASWNGDIPGGGDIDFGFIAAPGGTVSSPENVVLRSATG